MCVSDYVSISDGDGVGVVKVDRPHGLHRITSLQLFRGNDQPYQTSTTAVVHSDIRCVTAAKDGSVKMWRCVYVGVCVDGDVECSLLCHYCVDVYDALVIC